MTVKDILNEFGRTITKELSANLNTYGYKGGKIDASGKLRDSIKFTTRVLGQDFSFQLSMEDYYQWVDEGLKVGKWRPIAPLISWLRSKRSLREAVSYKKKFTKGKRSGIKESVFSESKIKSLAYVINRKIKEKGVKPTYFFSDVFNDEAVLKLKNNIRVAIQKDITIELIKE